VRREAQRQAEEEVVRPIAEVVVEPAVVESKERMPKRDRGVMDEDDDEYNGSAIEPDNPAEDDDDSFAYKPAKARSKSKPKSTTSRSTPAFLNADRMSTGELTPRAKHILEVVNSRDTKLIQSLSGVGAKKANDLVEFLELRSEEEEGGRIESLMQLMGVPGMGSRTVERMYEGVTV
jgi:DNA uptake protein ComE-like DNA-binding protein